MQTALPTTQMRTILNMVLPATDYDALSAEFYDASARGSGWAGELALSARVLAGFDPDAGPLLDIGAGTGLSTIALAEALPRAQIVALEPSRAMRAVLLSRVLGRPETKDRVTVLPGTLDSEFLPPRWGGMTGRGLLGHIPAEHRVRLWQLLAERLADGTHAVLDQVADHMPEPGRREIYRSATTQGELDYEVVIELDVAEDAATENLITSTTIHRPSGRLVASHEYRHRLSPVDVPTLDSELAKVGLVAHPEGTLCLVSRT